MRIFFAAAAFWSVTAGAAIEKTFPFKFQDAPLQKVIDYYATHTGQRFVLDSSVTNATINIVQPGKVSGKEAFNLLSASLALNSIAISERDGTMVLASAHNMQRSFIPVVNDLPPLQPEKLVTWIVTVKHADAGGIAQQVRQMTSKDGELLPNGPNRILVTDWVSSLYRIKELIDQIDKPPEVKAPVTPEKKG